MTGRGALIPPKNFSELVRLGSTDLRVSRLCLSSGYRLGGDGVRMAHERGVNFFHIAGRGDRSFAAEVARLARSERENLVIALHSYSRLGWALRRKVERDLKSLGLERFDILYLGFWQRRPYASVFEAGMELKRRGLVRFLAMAGHNRTLFGELYRQGLLDVLMVRYNAAHRGAEDEVLAGLPEKDGPGVTTYTATRWGDLVNANKMPPGEQTPSAADCYRFALSHARVHAAFIAPKTVEHLAEGLGAMQGGPMNEVELARMRRIGDHLHEHARRRFYG